MVPEPLESNPTHPALHLVSFSGSLHRELSVPPQQVDCLQRSGSLLRLAAPAQLLTLASLQAGPGAKQLSVSVLLSAFPCTDVEEGRQDAGPGAGALYMVTAPQTWKHLERRGWENHRQLGRRQGLREGAALPSSSRPPGVPITKAGWNWNAMFCHKMSICRISHLTPLLREGGIKRLTNASA